MSANTWHDIGSSMSSSNASSDDDDYMPEVIASDLNVEAPGFAAQVRGACALLFVNGIWMLGTFTPLVTIVLLWYGGSIAYTVVAGLVLITVYPYLSSGAVDESGGDWTASRSTIPDWGQHWHKSCGRIYESEGPDAWDKAPPTILCYHPHGIFTQGYIINGGLNRELPDDVVGLLATVLYHAPIFRLVFGTLVGGCRPASKDSFLRQMVQRKSFGIIPGGFQEAALMKLETDRVWINKRKGFIKYALQYGYRLRPIFTFGETETYWNFQGGWGFRMWLTSRSYPAVLPWGVWWCPILPRRSHLMTVFGAPLVLPKLPNPSREDVDKWHAAYVEALIALYNRHKGLYASNPSGELEVW